MVNPFRLIRDAVIRYRRTRGFGIHSPFAYGFITQVLRCRSPFYCWDELETEVKQDASIRWRDAKALFRTLNQAVPGRVYVSVEAAPIVTRIVKAWSKRCEVTSDPSTASFFILAGRDYPLTPGSAGEGRWVLFALDVTVNPLWESLVKGLKRGQTFTNSVTGIAVVDAKLPRHHFEIDY